MGCFGCSVIYLVEVSELVLSVLTTHTLTTHIHTHTPAVLPLLQFVAEIFVGTYESRDEKLFYKVHVIDWEGRGTIWLAGWWVREVEGLFKRGGDPSLEIVMGARRGLVEWRDYMSQCARMKKRGESTHRR